MGLIMDFLTACTYLLLFFSFLLVLLSFAENSYGKRIWFSVLFSISCIPIIYSLYIEKNQVDLGVHTGLGLSFLFTWIMTVIVFIIGLMLSFRKTV
ncbi:hypothetical protein [Falsibacillus albus]|uniref:Uncharacterized protein n=1 Tax=Falsibacillus albus TaxID=2478915 RepID=A0A3L7K652_9BACI|nr:hypothetical protein [Falsibacillus albus]RLQ96182.1 hypothetical protein D9X91_07780 [Falsibacillus albus]